ncbi:cysteine-rich receptor-like protein kinase, partial [Trifolium medium]|nr:cysteine-rich receptor-like protein kinase [Trifolium medium]
QILDGILIANEVVDEARKSKKDLLLFKVDFEKAYDSVDGAIWTQSWGGCLSRYCGGSG